MTRVFVVASSSMSEFRIAANSSMAGLRRAPSASARAKRPMGCFVEHRLLPSLPPARHSYHAPGYRGYLLASRRTPRGSSLSRREGSSISPWFIAQIRYCFPQYNLYVAKFGSGPCPYIRSLGRGASRSIASLNSSRPRPFFSTASGREDPEYRPGPCCSQPIGRSAIFRLVSSSPQSFSRSRRPQLLICHCGALAVIA